MKALLVSLLALVAVLVAGCASLEPYAAVVNGHRIAERDVTDELKAIRANGRYLDAVDQGDPSHAQILGTGTNTFNANFTAFVLNQDIDYQLVAAEVQRRHLKVSSADLTQAKNTVIQQVSGQDTYNAFPKWYQNKLRDRFANVIVLAKGLSSGVDETKARQYYDTHQAEFQQTCASHILVDTKEQADAIEARLAKGEDFAAVAKSDSKDPGSASKGGDVGCFNKSSQLVAEFLNAALAQPVGVVGPPVQSQFGFHIIKVTSRTVPPFDQVKDQAAQAVGQGGGQKLQTWITDALKKANVKMNPKYGRFDKSGTVPQVQAPQAPPGAQTNTSLPISPGSPTPGG